MRDSYTREKAKKKQEAKSGAAASYRKQYIFFEQLKFLDVTTRVTSGSIEESPDKEAEEDEPNQNAVTVDAVLPSQAAKRRRKSDKETEENDQLLQHLKARYVSKETEKPDDDKLFLLSLYSDLKKIPEHMKLCVKGQLISVLSAARQASFVPNVNISQYPHANQSYTQMFQDSHNTPVAFPNVSTNRYEFNHRQPFYPHPHSSNLPGIHSSEAYQTQQTAHRVEENHTQPLTDNRVQSPDESSQLSTELDFSDPLSPPTQQS